MYAGYKVIGPVLSPKGLSSFPIGDSYATPGNDLSLSLPPPPPFRPHILIFRLGGLNGVDLS